jgi:hypothetical protein
MQQRALIFGCQKECMIFVLVINFVGANTCQSKTRYQMKTMLLPTKQLRHFCVPSASKQAKQPHGRTKKIKRKKRNKETIQDQNTKPITISLNVCKQKLASS